MAYRYQITLSDEAREIIASMASHGLWGRTEAEVIKNMVYDHLRGDDNLVAAIFGKAARRSKVTVREQH